MLLPMTLEGIDHVQLAMPAGGEAQAIDFYEGVLGIAHVAKPPHLAVRGGCWFENERVKIHLGVEADFRPARKAHPALRVTGLAPLLEQLRAAGVAVRDDEPLPGFERAYVDDPFGNRIELMEKLPAPREALRKQYHFWPGEAGLDAWDVDRLIELSADLPVEDVEVAAIDEVDSVYWFDERHRATVRSVIEHARLIAQVELRYPIILGPDGRVMDGMHRIARALLEGRDTIEAVRFAVLPDPDHRNCRPDELDY